MTERYHTHYDNLKVATDAPPEVIRAAYKALSQRYHPDKNPDDAQAARIMAIINASYDVLSNPEKRKQHDADIARHGHRQQARTASQSQPSTPSQAPRPPAFHPAQNSKRHPTKNAQATENPSIRFGWFWMVLTFVAIGYLLSNGYKSAQKLPVPQSDVTKPARGGESHFDSPMPRSSVASAPTHPASPPSGIPDQVEGRVSAPALNLRSGPGVNFPAKHKLKFAEPITVIGADVNGWVSVNTRSGSGFVNKSYVLTGEPQSTLTALCPPDQAPPANGTVLAKAFEGEHALSVTAPASVPALIKLKGRDGSTVFLAYVDAGRTITFNGIPDGSYQAWFATGSGYSRQCEQFTDQPAITFDPNFIDYRIETTGFQRYAATHMTYRLQRTVGGNFSPSSAKPEDF